MIIITTAVGLGYPSPCGRTSVGLREHETTLGKRVFNGDLEAPRLRSGPHENFFLAFSRFRPKNFWATASASTLMGRLRRPEPQGTLTPNRRHSICAIERTTPGGTARSPLQYRQERTPQAESHTARKRRLDRNRQAANYGMKRAARDDGSTKAKPTRLDYEKMIVETINPQQPDDGIKESLEDRMLLAQRSHRKDIKDAVAVLRERDCEPEEQVAAAVHLMVGTTSEHRWTLCAKERVRCEACGRAFARRADGRIRKHDCYELAVRPAVSGRA
jgi:hypothetical protein